MAGVFMTLFENENSILLLCYVIILFYYIYFTLVLEFMSFIQKKDFLPFFGTNFLLRKSGYYCENHPVIGLIIN